MKAPEQNYTKSEQSISSIAKNGSMAERATLDEKLQYELRGAGKLIFYKPTMGGWKKSSRSEWQSNTIQT